MNCLIRRIILPNLLLSIVFFSQAQTTNVYTTATIWTVPGGVNSISIKVYGGAGGTGGQDCGAGCSNPAGGPTGFVVAVYAVTPGDVVGIYPGTNGVNGSNSVTGTGGGNGGVASYNVTYNGGKGGNAGTSGSSGGGGGGGAASIITINSVIKIVSGGAGGGGGMANLAGPTSGQPGSSSTSSNGTNAGGNGTSASGDGGGGGGGGGGQFASNGGGVHPAGGETAGDGGFLGGNSVTGASSITTNANIAWTTTGQIEITFTSTLPVTWLSFTANKQGSGIALKWSTATSQNAWDYKVQHSTDGATWSNIGTVTAVSNSNSIQQYGFVDANPTNGINYYRLLQSDIDGSISYSKIVLLNLTDAAHWLKISPNPVTNGMITVTLQEPSILRVYNSIGVLVLQKELPAGDQPLNVSSLPKGVYCMKAARDVVMLLVQ